MLSPLNPYPLKRSTMKKLILILVYLFILLSTGNAQKLTLPELINLCDKQNWESINSSLSAKSWTYFDSKKGDSDYYNTITWSFNKDRYTNKAQGWFYLYTYDGQPNKLSYVTLSKAFSSQIQNSLASSGFKHIDSRIEDSQVISTYANATYKVEVSTQRRDEDEWSDASLTAYQISLIKKAGIYDPDNGKKKSYHDNGELETEYTLKNGQFDGAFVAYYENGQIEKKGYYAEGKANGKFVEFDEEGLKTAEYTMSNGEPNGLAILYKGGLKSVEKEYVNGTQTGKYTQYLYNETGQLYYKIAGTSIDGKKNGKWTAFVINDEKEEEVEFWNYKNSIKHGDVKELVSADTIEIARYKDGVLDGPYQRQVRIEVYAGEKYELTYLWQLDAEGEYNAGQKNGKWITYDFGNSKFTEGSYLNDKKEGKWIKYLTVGKRHYGQVYSEETYSKDLRNGPSNRYFEVEQIDTTTDPELPSSYYNTYPIKESIYFTNDIKNGPYELKDSTGIVITKGNYLNGLRDDLWIEGFNHEYPDGTNSWLYFSGNYKNGKEEGKWVSYFDRSLLLKTMTYKLGELHGEYISWNQLGKPAESKMFDNGNLTELTVYDSAGEKTMTKYSIYNENSSSLMCRQSEYFDDKIVSQEYKIFRQERIDHSDFEKVFLNLTGITSNNIYGHKDGIYKVTTTGGEVLVSGRYFKEDKIGLWTYAYPSQQVVLEQNYDKGQPTSERYLTPAGQPYSGEFVYHDAAAGLNEERKIKNGLRNGRTVYLDSNNKVIRKETYKEGALK